MRNNIVATIILFSLLYGCVPSPSTGEPDILYGMNKDDVVEILNAKSNEIVSIADTKIIAVGNWELTNQMRKKIFYFDDDKLVRVSYQPVDEE